MPTPLNSAIGHKSRLRIPSGIPGDRKQQQVQGLNLPHLAARLGNPSAAQKCHKLLFVGVLRASSYARRGIYQRIEEIPNGVGCPRIRG